MYITQLLIYQIFHTYNIMTTIYNYILLYLGLKMFFKSFSTHGFNVKVIVTRTYILLHYALLSVTLTFRWFLWVRLQGHIMHRFFGWYRFEKLSRSLFFTPSIRTYYDWKTVKSILFRTSLLTSKLQKCGNFLFVWTHK